jgi:hypothetical protein
MRKLPVETEVPTVTIRTDGRHIIEFIHRLGGPVDVVGYDQQGMRVGVIANEISPDEVEVIDVAGTAFRLVASRTVDDEQDA